MSAAASSSGSSPRRDPAEVSAAPSELSCSVATLTDPQRRSVAIQTRQPPRYEQAAAESREALMRRMESALSVQKELQAGYQGAARQLALMRAERVAQDGATLELRQTVASYEEELKAAAAASARAQDEVAAAEGVAMATLEARCQSRVEAVLASLSENEAEVAALRRNSASHEEVSYQLALAVQRAEAAESAAQTKARALFECEADAEGAVSHFEQGLKSLHDELRESRHGHRVLEEKVVAESTAAAEAKVLAATLRGRLRRAEAGAKATADLRTRCESLVNSATVAKEAQAALETSEAVIAETRAELQRVERRARAELEAQAAIADGLRISAAQCPQVQVPIGELAQLKAAERDLRLQLEASEAAELWQEIARKEDQDEWRKERWALEARAWEAERKELRCSEMEALAADKRALQSVVQAEETTSLLAVTTENRRLLQSAQELHQELVTAQRAVESLRAECNAEAFAAKRAEGLRERDLAASHGRQAALLEEMERLREAAGQSRSLFGDAVTASDGELERDRLLRSGDLSSDQNASRRSERAEVKRLQRVIAQERDQREQLRQRAADSEREVAQLRASIKDTEQQLRLCREDADRKRALVTVLQRRCGQASPDASCGTAAADLVGSETGAKLDEARRRLSAAQKDLARKDLAIQELSKELQQARIQLQEQRRREETGAARAEADAARARALRAEAQRKDEALRQAQSRAQVFQAELAAHERAASTARASRFISQRTGATARSAEDPRFASLEKRRLPVVSPSDSFSGPLPLTDDSHYAEETTAQPHLPGGSSPSATPEPFSALDRALQSSASSALLSAGGPFSSLDVSAVEDSINILNLRAEDLGDFLLPH